MKRNLVLALKILFFLSIGIFFIWIFLRKLTPDEKQQIWVNFLNANYFWLAVSVILGIISHIVRARRWNLLLEPMGYHPGLRNTFFAVMIGYLANTALPRLGEVTRCGVLNKYEKIPLPKSFGTVLIERSLDLAVFILLFFMNLLLFYDKLGIYVNEKIFRPLSNKFTFENSAVVTIALILFLFLLITSVIYFGRHKLRHFRIYQKVKELVSGFLHGLKAITQLKRPFAFVFQTLLIWFLYYMMIYVCFFAMPETSHLGLDVALSLLIFGSIGIMLVQGGIGIYPAIIAETLLLYNIPATYGYALGWLGWLAQTIMIIAVGLISLVLLPVFNKT